MTDSNAFGQTWVLVGAIAAMLLVLVGGGAAVWIFGPSLEAGREYRGMQDMMMQRKADAMEDLLDATLYGRLGQVASSAERIQEYTDTIDAFLGTPIYEQQGAAFRQALADVKKAADAQDRAATKEAALRLERSCLECHHLLLERAAWVP